jgi:hypothetical protein
VSSNPFPAFRETFTIHRIISVLCLSVAALLFTQPQVLQLTTEPPSAKPLFSLDSAFSWPLDVLSYEDNDYTSSPSYDVSVILFHLAVPVLLAFTFVFIFICKDVHLSVVAFWMGIGGGAAAFYGEIDTV